MLVNYYYVCIRLRDGKPWWPVIGISLKENDGKKTCRGAGFFFWQAVKPPEPRLFLSFPPLQTLLTHSFVQ
jgi:hypothetical protein